MNAVPDTTRRVLAESRTRRWVRGRQRQLVTPLWRLFTALTLALLFYAALTIAAIFNATPRSAATEPPPPAAPSAVSGSPRH
jgi:heme/copper-type cytochrome/quinol oxidase subunit 1